MADDAPRAGAPRAGAPRAGAPRAGAPRAGAPRADAPRDGAGSRDPHPKSADVAALTASELAEHFARGDLAAAEVTEQLIQRIDALDTGAAGIRSVLELAPDAVEVAAARDRERRAGATRGPLHGVPVLVKDNIDTAAPLHTTAGSLVFSGSGAPGSDATLVRVLRDAGAVVLGKANLSEWANFRGSLSSSGWSAVGGQTRNPHALDRSPGGSSSGSAAAVACRFVPLAVGTETDGSILCPAALCGIAGLKPTLGLVSRTGIVPIADSQDTAGPMARSTKDLALLLSVLAGATDDGEDVRAARGRRPGGYRPVPGAGTPARLDGLRIGIVRDEPYVGYHSPTDAVFTEAVAALAGRGARIVDPVTGLPGPPQWSEDEMVVLTHEFRSGVEAYLARRARGAEDGARLPRTVDHILAHANAEPRERTDVFGTDLMAAAAATEGASTELYLSALARMHLAARGGLDAMFARWGVDLLALPATTPAWPIDHVLGDRDVGSGWSPAAVAGYPSATLPMGTVHGLPVGIALCGPAWSEALLLRALLGLEDALGPSVTCPIARFAPSTVGPAGGP